VDLIAQAFYNVRPPAAGGLQGMLGEMMKSLMAPPPPK
jgi:hypothetical protein